MGPHQSVQTAVTNGCNMLFSNDLFNTIYNFIVYSFLFYNPYTTVMTRMTKEILIDII